MKALVIKSVRQILDGLQTGIRTTSPLDSAGDLLLCELTEDGFSRVRAAAVVELVDDTHLPDGRYWEWNFRHVRPVEPFFLAGQRGVFEVDMTLAFPGKNESDSQAWRRAMGILKKRSPYGVWCMWFARLGLAFVQGDQAVVMTENKLIRDWIRGRHMAMLEGAVAEAWDHPMGVVLVTCGDDPADYGLEPENLQQTA